MVHVSSGCTICEMLDQIVDMGLTITSPESRDRVHNYLENQLGSNPEVEFDLQQLQAIANGDISEE